MIAVNAKKLPGAAGLTLAECLTREGYVLTRIAVELNGAIVPRTQYGSTVLADGDNVEVVCFVGGG
ncbi:MAG: sulfur carrier protein ThiS [Sporomusaceae bacterium]|nr:sulfur carrier protein ThiS [Sporomusaceae bacterium]